jgi:AraC-like DNA-binding protein
MPSFLPNKEPIEHIYSNFHIEFKKKFISKKDFVHWHNTGEFILAESGISTSIVENESVNIKAPYIIYYPPYQLHSQYNETTPDFNRYCISIDSSYLDGAVSELPQSFVAFELDTDEYKRLDEYASLLLKYYNTPPTCYTEVQLERRKYLLLLFINELTPLFEKYRPDIIRSRIKYINKVCAYINSHYMERLSLADLADKFFVSRTKLTHDFRKSKNISICDYITAVRISKSKILLRDGLPISEIAHRCGFSSSTYYIKVFEKHNHVTPAKFRESPKTYMLLN